MSGFYPLFHIDSLSIGMMIMVGFVGLVVAVFSKRYLKGNHQQGSFYGHLTGLLVSIYVMVCADHIWLLLGSWGISNLFLVRLMLHKKQWSAARKSALLAFKTLGLGFLFFASALMILYNLTGQTSLNAIYHHLPYGQWVFGVGVLLMLAAMAQSALFPFHKWLLSSLNSPTPVSAIMHAGLINGGGFLLVRFSPLIINQPDLLNMLFIAGMISALVGTLWKLMQNDVKRMLACSTMAQMGFMIVQCGLGLFPAAVTHLWWHGLFKAYLFLGSGAAANENRLDLEYPPSIQHFLIALIFGMFGGFAFCFVSGKNIFAGDTSLFLIFLAVISVTQSVLPIVRKKSITQFPLVFIGAMIIGATYGFCVDYAENWLLVSSLQDPQPLNMLHWVAIVLFTLSWFAMLFIHFPKHKQSPHWILKAYVWMLNWSQPHPSTITAHRNHYQS